MKRKLIVLSLALVLIFSFGFFACNDESDPQTATAYGMVHMQYAGQVTVQVVRKGKNYKIESVEIKEYLPLSDIGVMTFTVPENEEEAVTYTIHGTNFTEDEIDLNDFVLAGNRYYAKRIKVGDQIFTYQKFDAMSSQDTDVYAYYNQTYSNLTTYALYSKKTMADKGLTIKNSYENPEFTQWYIEKMKAGEYYILKGEGNETYNVDFTSRSGSTTTKNTWADKSQNGYWPANDSSLGWKENISRLEKAIKTYGLEVYTGEETKGDNGYMLGVNPTGATIADYHQYMAIAKAAYEQAKNKINEAEKKA